MGSQRKYTQHREWTKEEEDLLVELCDKAVPQSKIAKKLGRTKSSVKSKRLRMELPSMDETLDMMRITEAAELLGINSTGMHKSWKSRGLKTIKKGSYRVVSENHLINIMQKNPDLWLATKCDYHFFAKYDWFLERLEAERNGTWEYKGKQRRREWSNYEISRLKMLYSRGLTHKQIANELNRGEMSVCHVVMRLKKEGAMW